MSVADGGRVDLQIGALERAYSSGATTPERVLEEILRRVEARAGDSVWISRQRAAELHAQLDRARARRAAGVQQPLFGVPFAVKDNLDVAGMPTTAACPEFSHVPRETAPVVQRLLDAGAVLVGKTNMDQFATGLVGTRTPYGACSSVFDSRYVSGGSSSGSAVAVAAGLVSFALGTDTAGSGRVPAAFNGIVGYKPSRGLLSTRGLVPACRSLDCVSVFACSTTDAWRVLDVAGGYDARDPYSRQPVAASRGAIRTVGVLAGADREFFGDVEAERLYDRAVEDAVGALGLRAVPVDFALFHEAAQLLYEGPWIAERSASIGFHRERPDAVHPVVRGLLERGEAVTGVQAFRGWHRLSELQRAAAGVFEQVDGLLLPTTPTTYTIAEVLADPLVLNQRLGRYTNFANLLDLCAIALPAGRRPNGLPFGVTLFAPAFADDALFELAARREAAFPEPIGVTGHLPRSAVPRPPAPSLLLAVAGAHLSGQAKNHELTDLGARLHATRRTAACYRLYALPGPTPARPGLVRDPGFRGDGMEVEVWAVPPSRMGEFMAKVPAPLAIGRIELDDGEWVSGFVCEPCALAGATEITHHGGFRAYLRHLAQS